MNKKVTMSRWSRKSGLSIVLIFALFSTVAAQQQEASTVMSLEDCINYALENSVSIKNARIDQEIAVSKVKETRGIGLPQVNGEVQLVHNQKLGRFFTSFSENGFFFSEPIPGVNEGDVLAAQNFFQLKSSGSANLSISQLIFNGSYIVGLQASNTYKELSIRAFQQSEEQVIQNVSKAYYSVLTTRENLKIFDNNIERIDSLLKMTSVAFANGLAEEIDVDGLTVALNNLETEKAQVANIYEFTQAMLKFQMNYPLEGVLEIKSQDLNSLMLPIAQETDSKDWSYENRADYQIVQTQRKLQRLDLKNKYATTLPTLVAFGNLGMSTQSPTFAGLFKTETNFPKTDALGPDQWYSSSLFGVTLSVPIFSGGQRNYQIQQSKLNLSKIENLVGQMEAGMNMEVESSSTNFENALKVYNAQKINVKLSEKIVFATSAKYAQGLVTSRDVIDSETTLKDSQVNYYNAILNALLAKVDLDKAKGQIRKTDTTQK